MSSGEFAARLRASYSLRYLVLASGALFTLAGLLVIVTWPIDPGWRVVLAATWSAFGSWELAQLRRVYMTYGYIEVGSDGSVRLAGNDHTTVVAELLPGSVLLGHVGWLLLKTPDGSRSAELMYGNPRKNKDWRRLQVIWRHL